MKTGQRQNCLFMRLNGYTGGMKMNELELKYGCNPNQKPSRIFMADGSELPIKVLCGKPGYINFLDAFNGWQLVRELKEELDRIFVQNEEYNSLMVTVMSFGFKHGIPADADLVFDVRFLPNPYYIEELKPQTGNDKGVQDYVMSFPETGIFLDKLTDMIQFLIPNYIKEGKYRLVIAIGCTGGKHRSVTLANKLYERLKAEGHYGIKLYHRDVPREGI